MALLRGRGAGRCAPRGHRSIGPGCYERYSVALPSALLEDGSLQVCLLLMGPGLLGPAGVNLGHSRHNRAGLDFARLRAPNKTRSLGMHKAALGALRNQEPFCYSL
jgi:hypothetical protein